ncbi:MAG: DUF2069 domain-containing protein [Steroidobacteraceae bacterium]
MNGLTPQQRSLRRWVLISWSALLLLVCWQQLQQNISLTHFGWAALYSLPLLAPLHGLLQGKRYTHSWATLCVLPYFIIGISESVSNPSLRHWAMALLGCSLLWFFALLGFLRVTPATPTITDAAGSSKNS